MDKMTRNLLFNQLLINPLPWRIDGDWTHEVKASNGILIAKCQTLNEAEEIINAAESIRTELDSIVVGALIVNAD